MSKTLGLNRALEEHTKCCDVANTDRRNGILRVFVNCVRASVTGREEFCYRCLVAQKWCLGTRFTKFTKLMHMCKTIVLLL
jgi:hypothetical protein